MSSDSNQARRVVFLLKRFQSGYRYTVKEATDLLSREFGEISDRSVQRDIKALSDIEPLLESNRVDGEIVWRLNDEHFRTRTFALGANELLSMYLLKAQLKNFRNTFVAKEIDAILEAMEKRLPSNVFLDRELFWDKNIGAYDYSECDEIIKKVIETIVEKKAAYVTYDPLENGEFKEYRAFLKKIFSYAGYLYCASYVPEFGYFVALAIHRMKKVFPTFVKDDEEIPDFNYDEFSKNRFGVFAADPKNIGIRIEKEFVRYFENRHWHPTQKFEIMSDGSAELEMFSSVSPELVAWLLGWGEGLKVLEPDELKKKIVAKISKTLAIYEKD